MEKEKKNNNVLIVVTIVMTLLVVALGSYIVYDKLILEANNSKETQKDNEENKENKDNKDNLVDETVVYKSLEECNSDSCAVYKSKDFTVIFKNIEIEGNEEIPSATSNVRSDVYINEKYSKNINFKYENAYNDLSVQVINNEYILLRFANESIYRDFYLFNKNGEFITDFSKEKKEYDLSLNVHVENGQLIMDYYNLLQGPISYEYCEYKEKPTDAYKIIKNVSINNGVIHIDKTTTITWEEAYKCGSKYGDGESCGDINTIVCE